MPIDLEGGEPQLTPTRWAVAGAFLGCAIGLLFPWVIISAGTGSASFDGVDTGDGRFFAVILVVVLALGWWRYFRTSRRNGCLLFLSWLALLAFAVYEMANVNSLRASSPDLVNVGFGLYLAGVAATIGLVATGIDVRRRWRQPAQVGQSSGYPRTLTWLAAATAILALFGAGIGGYRHGSGNSANSGVNTDNNTTTLGHSRPNGNSGKTGTGGNSGNSGAFGNSGGGNAGNSGTLGNTGSANTGSGNTGNSGGLGSGRFGNSGSSGVAGNSGAFGNTGGTGITGDSGAFGNSGSGNTGDSGAFGNTGGTGDSGNTGTDGNSNSSGSTGNTA